MCEEGDRVKLSTVRQKLWVVLVRTLGTDDDHIRFVTVQFRKWACVHDLISARQSVRVE